MVYLRDDITCNYQLRYYISLKRKCHGVFTYFVKNGETRPSLQLQIILEQQEERSQRNSCKEQLIICTSAFWTQISNPFRPFIAMG